MSGEFDEIDILKAELFAAGYRGDTCSAKGSATTPNSDYDWLGNDIRITGPCGTFTFRSKDLTECWRRAWEWAFGSGGCPEHGGVPLRNDLAFDDECANCQIVKLGRERAAWELLAREWRQRAAGKQEDLTSAFRGWNEDKMAWILRQVDEALPDTEWQATARDTAIREWRTRRWALPQEKRAAWAARYPWLRDSEG